MDKKVSKQTLFKELNLNQPLHPKFKQLKEHDFFKEHRVMLDDWFQDFQDRDGKIIKEFQTSFHSSFFEIYLFKVFRELDYEIDFSKNRPDFILKNGNEDEIYVEATVSNISINGRKEENRDFMDIMGVILPPHLNENFNSEINEAIIRYSNSIITKIQKYRKEYSKLEWIKNDSPYVIALSSYAQVNYGREYIFGIIALLYGMYYSKKEKNFKKKNYVEKENGALISLGIFKTEEFSDISAIIFTSNLTIGKIEGLINSENNDSLQDVITIYQDFFDSEVPYKVNLASEDSPELLTDGLWIFHNPYAKNKLNVFDFYDKGIINVSMEKGRIYTCGNGNPTVSRLNYPKVMRAPYFQYIENIIESYNQNENFDFTDCYYDLHLEKNEKKGMSIQFKERKK